MTPERYQQLKKIFFGVQETDLENRAAFLAENCRDDRELQKAVLELLASSVKANGFIERAAYDVLSDTLVADLPAISIEGQRIGAYKILREINHGGMGLVYLASRDDNLFQKQVAIKIVRGSVDSGELRRRFCDERRILARLEHPNIARLLDGGTTDDGLPYYAMDYVEGLALDQYCEQNNLSIPERLTLFRKVCAAVQYAHRNLVIHRDLKPSNILVTTAGVPQLVDFGIAKVFQDQEQGEATRTKLPMMTPEYASPEQISGEVITTASDIYSLGIILYELLTGHRLFQFKANSLEEIIQVITKVVPPKPSQAVANRCLRGADSADRKSEERSTSLSPSICTPQSLRGDLDNIVLKALRKEPERRYATVDQFAEDIRRHLSGLPVIARSDTFFYRSSRFIKRNRVGVTVAAVIFVVLVVGAIAIMRQTQAARRESRVAAEERSRAVRAQAKAERINKFFQEMLGFANPSWYAPGYEKPRDLTVTEALDVAARKIQNDLHEEPEVKADILLTIGDTFASIGRFEQSERALESAVRLRRDVFGENDVKLAGALFILANTKRGLNKRGEMMELYEQAYSIYRRNPGEESDYPYFLLDYANSFSDKGNHEANVRLTGEAIEILRRTKGENNAAVAIARMNLATAYYKWGDMEKAAAEGWAAYELVRPPAPMTGVRVGQIILASGDLERAEPMLVEALSRLQVEDNWYVSGLLSLAHLYQERSEHQKAEASMARAIVIDRRIYSPGHPTLLSHLALQGLIMTRAGRSQQGEAVMRQAINQMSAEQRKGFQGMLGECLLIQKRYSEAEPLLRSYYHMISETQHRASPLLRKAREHLRIIDNFRLRQGN